MNLVIDVGNTLAKTALFNGSELVSFSSFETPAFSTEKVKTILSGNPGIQAVILTSVIRHDNAINGALARGYTFVEFTDATRLPVENLYRSPETLGKDRLAAAVGARALCMGMDVLAVDAGTCIKYDFVNAKGQYLGGGISPGIDMRFKALNQFTDKLPLISYRQFDQLVGQTTEESILSGVMNGAAEEARGIIGRYRGQYPGMKVVLTGGYLKFLEKIFNTRSNENSDIFADSFLVLKGLNEILNFNLAK